jgi:hypothetical protein
MNIAFAWQTIVEFFKNFFDYAMNVGENHFLFLDYQIYNLNSGDNSHQGYVIITLIIMAVIYFVASSGPLDEIGPRILGIFKSVIFAAAIFSLHTFYKTFVILVAKLAKDSTGSAIINCFGTYINPISIFVFAMILSLGTYDTKTTSWSCLVQLYGGRVQAFFIGLSLFLIPALLCFNTFTKEHVTIFVVAICLSFMGLLLYGQLTMFYSFLVMSISYLIAKYFLVMNSEMVSISDRVKLTDFRSVLDSIGKYLSCMRIDIGMIMALLAILLILRIIADDVGSKKIKGAITWTFIIFGVFVFTYPSRSKLDVDPVVYARNGMEVERVDVPVTITSATASSTLTSSSGTVYGIENTLDGNPDTCWEEGSEGGGEGETLTYTFDESEIAGISIYNGVSEEHDRYYANNRIKEFTVEYLKDGDSINTDTFTFPDKDPTEYQLNLDGETYDCDTVVITIKSVYQGSTYDDTGIMEVKLTQKGPKMQSVQDY